MLMYKVQWLLEMDTVVVYRHRRVFLLTSYTTDILTMWGDVMWRNS